MSTQSLARPIDYYVEIGKKAMRNAKSQATKDAYSSDWRLFVDWCERHDEVPLPATAKTLIAYMAYLAHVPHPRTKQAHHADKPQTRRISTMQRVLVSISQAHKAASVESATGSVPVREAMKGFRREKGMQREKKSPLRKDDLRLIFMKMREPDAPIAIRDRAILLIGFAGGFRRSELVALCVEDLQFTNEGVVITIRRSKTDQEGQGREVAIWRGGALCPVRALQNWLTLAGIESGVIFRPVHWSGSIQKRGLSREMIALVVKRHAALIGKKTSDFAGHSLRRGMASEGARNGATESALMRQGGWKSSAMVREYIEEATLFENNVSALLGL